MKQKLLTMLAAGVCLLGMTGCSKEDDVYTMMQTNGSYTGLLTKADAAEGAGINKELASAIGYDLLSGATPADVGMVVCEAGHLHTAKAPVPVGCTAVGILAHVANPTPGQGLILALQDAPRQTWTAIQGWQSETLYNGTTLKLLPDTARGHLAAYTQLGNIAVSGWGVGQKADYEAIFKNLGSKSADDKGTGLDSNVNVYITSANGDSITNGWCASENSHWLYGDNWHDLYYTDYLYPVRAIMSYGEVPRGAVNGKFTIGNGKMVYFSKGNLQYVGTWQFAEHQWDCFGTDQRDNHRDLFGWGTASNPNNVSTGVGDYSWSEWGTTPIANAATGYRTLTSDECIELMSNLRKYNHSGLATVNGVRGVVMLCDKWTLPSGCTFTPIPQDSDTYTDWNSNTYTAEQWAAMEAAGAVFLPCAGQRNGTLTDLVNVYPFYWLSSKWSDREAYTLSYTNKLNMGYAIYSTGMSVRLVKDAE